MTQKYSVLLKVIKNMVLPIDEDLKMRAKSKPVYKISPTIINDTAFQDSLKEAVHHWIELKVTLQHNTIQ